MRSFGARFQLAWCWRYSIVFWIPLYSLLYSWYNAMCMGLHSSAANPLVHFPSVSRPPLPVSSYLLSFYLSRCLSSISCWPPPALASWMEIRPASSLARFSFFFHVYHRQQLLGYIHTYNIETPSWILFLSLAVFLFFLETLAHAENRYKRPFFIPCDIAGPIRFSRVLLFLLGLYYTHVSCIRFDFWGWKSVLKLSATLFELDYI